MAPWQAASPQLLPVVPPLPLVVAPLPPLEPLPVEPVLPVEPELPLDPVLPVEPVLLLLELDDVEPLELLLELPVEPEDAPLLVVLPEVAPLLEVALPEEPVAWVPVVPLPLELLALELDELPDEPLDDPSPPPLHAASERVRPTAATTPAKLFIIVFTPKEFRCADSSSGEVGEYKKVGLSGVCGVPGRSRGTQRPSLRRTTPATKSAAPAIASGFGACEAPTVRMNCTRAMNPSRNASAMSHDDGCASLASGS